MDRVLLKHAALYILCEGNPEAIRARRKQAKQLYNHKVEELGKAYRQLAHGNGQDPMHLSWIPCDYAESLSCQGGMSRRSDVLTYSIERDGLDLKGFAANAYMVLENRKRAQYQLALNPRAQNALGYLPTAQVLFVGDQCNQKHRSMLWPFYEYDNCSLFLTKCLHMLNFREELGMWTNANAGMEFFELVGYKPDLKVIALGAQASATLHKYGVKHTEIPHPQFGRHHLGRLNL